MTRRLFALIVCAMPAAMALLADRVGRPNPLHEFTVDLLGSSQAEMVDMIAAGKGVDAKKARMDPSFRQDKVAPQGGPLHGNRHEGHARVKRDPRLLRQHGDRAARLDLLQQAGKQQLQARRLAREVILEWALRSAEMELVAAGK